MSGVRRLVCLPCVLIVISAIHPAGAAAQGAEGAVARPLPALALEDDGSDRVFELIAAATGARVPVAVRVAVDSVESMNDARLDRFGQTPLWLMVNAPDSAAEVDRWRTALRRSLVRRGESLAVLEVNLRSQTPAVAAYAVQVASIEARATRPSVQIALGGEPMNEASRRTALYTAALAPYVDLLAVRSDANPLAANAAVAKPVVAPPAVAPPPVADRVSAGSALADWLERVDPGARILTISSAGPADDGTRLVSGVLEEAGTAVVSHAWPLSALSASSLQTLSSLTDVLQHDVEAVEPGAVSLALSVSARDVTATLRYRVLFDTERFATFLVYWGEASPEPLTLTLHVPVEGTPAVIDVLTGQKLAVADYAREPGSGVVHGRVPLTGRPMLVDFNEGETALGEQSGVSASRQLTVGEIISRHQQQQLAQERLVRNYVAHARMQQYFRPQEIDAGYDIVTENRYFAAEDGVEWEELSLSFNNRHFSKRPPSAPIIQPEKLFALPLQLRFDEGYRYRLVGTARVGAFNCYEVRFDPERDDPSLYRGTVWIDRVTFARVRVQAVQGSLPGMVIANEETWHFAPVVSIGNTPVFLFTSIEGTQNVLVAGRTIRLDKRVAFTDFVVNGADFEERRATARQSDRVMFRETPKGLRYYVKEGDWRVVSDRLTEGVKAMALGTVIDPSYAFPLPIFGINLVDFSFLNKDTQLAMLFAGVLAAGNIQRPQIWSKRVDASIDFFGIAAPSSERLYQPQGEAESERLLTWPLSAGLNLGWRATPFDTLTLQYQVRFDGYARDTTTDDSFVLPSSTVTSGIGGNWAYNRAGFSASLNAAWFTRSTWRPWGTPGADGTLTSTPRGYAKYTASLSRDILIGPLQKVHLNGSWFGGRDLDRFVKYQFGLFDSTRIHGVPASIRFGELAMARGSYSLNILDQYRLDLFFDHGWGRDGGADHDWRPIPGVGVAVNVPAPWNTILRADVGKSWLPERYGNLGSTSLQIMLLKPLK